MINTDKFTQPFSDNICVKMCGAETCAYSTVLHLAIDCPSDI
jgi:hypothetical protein